MIETENPTLIDLFCGCGGFSLGLKNAGFQILAAIDFNKEAINVYKKNFPNERNVLCRDLTKFPPESLAWILSTSKVDVIAGGPPCQGFSTVRKRDGSNNGPRLIEDNRRFLYREFLRYVEFFKPKIFIMENVLGIKTAECGKYYRCVQAEARKLGYRVHGIVISGADYGVPQKRKRQLIIGTQKDLPVYFREKYITQYHINTPVTLGEAICDLPPLEAGEGNEEVEYDLRLRNAHIARYDTRYIFDVLKINQNKKLTAHRARPHNERDLRDFSRLEEGENSQQAIQREENLEFPYDRNCFKDRYTRQHRDSLCSTIVAHLSKDGLMFIHPTQNRSLTPREAARIQSFPDYFELPVARTHQYRLIGNAVPPLVGKVVGKAIKNYFVDLNDIQLNNINKLEFRSMPKNQIDAADKLIQLISAADNGTIKSIPAEQFKKGWYAIAYLFPILHPDGFHEKENGFGESYDNSLYVDDVIKNRYPILTSPCYVQSGCPVALKHVVKEAWRRYKNKELQEDEFYNSQALLAGRINHKVL